MDAIIIHNTDNPSMIAINRKQGYVQTPGSYRKEKNTRNIETKMPDYA